MNFVNNQIVQREIITATISPKRAKQRMLIMIAAPDQRPEKDHNVASIFSIFKTITITYAVLR